MSKIWSIFYFTSPYNMNLPPKRNKFICFLLISLRIFSKLLYPKVNVC